MGWVYVDDDGYPAPQPVRRTGGFAAGLFNLFLWALVLLLIAAVGYTLFSEIRGGSEGAMPAPAAQPASGVFTALPAPGPAPGPVAPVEVAPVEVAPIIQAPALETAPEVEPGQVSNDIPADWRQNVFGEAAPAMSEIPQMAPEGGVAPEEVSSGIDPNWRCNVFGECGGGQ